MPGPLSWRLPPSYGRVDPPTDLPDRPRAPDGFATIDEPPDIPRLDLEPWNPFPYIFFASWLRAIKRESPSLLHNLADCWDLPVKVEIHESTDTLPPTWGEIRFENVQFFALSGSTHFMQYVLQAVAFGLVSMPVGGGLANGAYVSAATLLLPEIRRVLDETDLPVMLTGHSYGAAVALVLARELEELYPQRAVGVVVFGCPKVGNQAFCDLFTKPVVRIENTGDIVTEFPAGLGHRLLPANPGVGPLMNLRDYRHAGHAFVIDYNGFVYDGTTVSGWLGQQWAGLMQTAIDVRALAVERRIFPAHNISQYIRRLRGAINRGYLALGQSYIFNRWHKLLRLNDELNQDGGA